MNENAFLFLPFASIISIIKQFGKPLSGRSISVLIGFNTNVIYDRQTYHIQTEDSGLDKPEIVSRLYLQGEIITTKKIGYADIPGEPDSQEKIKRLMTEQHSSMIKELLAGRYTERFRSGNTGEGS